MMHATRLMGWVSLCLFTLMAMEAGAQVRSGVGFLKMLPGARMQAMGSAFTAVPDEMHAFYANPAAGGFLREWQWSASYSKWFAGLYNASLLYGRKVATPWSQSTHFNIGLFYQGMPDFDSSNGDTPAVSANDLLITANIGQPISILTRNLSAGSNIKYYHSKLAQYDASAWIYDFGLFYRTPRFVVQNTGPLRYAIASAGLALTNAGDDIAFLSVGTPLPQALRAGIALTAGSHHGWQLQLSADYLNRRDEGDHYGFGAEVKWQQRLALQGGYDSNRDLMSRYSFGISYVLDDQSAPAGSVIPGRNDALRLDIASVEELDFFSNTYRGSLSGYPIGPEKFSFRQPLMNGWVYADTVTLSCTASCDPDLFDDLQYAVILDPDSVKLANWMSNMESGLPKLGEDADNFLLARKALTSSAVPVQGLRGGDYYWSAIAYDSDWHMRPAAKNGRTISSFHIPLTDVAVDSIWFEYSPWLTVDDYHGVLHIQIANHGERNLPSVSFSVVDSLTGRTNPPHNPAVPGKLYLMRSEITNFRAGEKRIIDILWRTSDLGPHCISAAIDEDQRIREDCESNNLRSALFFTIPKGSIAAKDSVMAVNFARRSFDLPIITEVCFDTLSSVVKDEYLTRQVIEPVLETMSSRLQENPELKIALQGFADTNSGETDVALADLRANAVRDSMLHRGVRPEQIEIIPGAVLPRRYVPLNPQDALWVFQERRFVKINADENSQNVLFQPITFVDIEQRVLPVSFLSIIRGYVPIDAAQLAISNASVRDTLDVKNRFLRADLKGNVEWRIDHNPDREISEWIDRRSTYDITLTDSLGRTFKSRPRFVYMRAKSYLQEHTVAFPLQFASTDPLYTFYWANIFQFVKQVVAEPHRRFRFFGHACAIGSAAYNLRLSAQRAKAFHDGFLEYTRQNYPELLETVTRQTESSVGFGETRPIGVTRSTGEFILIGDNNIPTGRKLNRRIEINFYSTENLLLK